MTAILINTTPVQNWMVKVAAGRLSHDLKTTVSIKHVSFALFNKMNLEGAYIADQKNDTLLYAGNLQVRITDWFFFKKAIELKYVGLENATIYAHRVDSVWNYQFIIDHFSGPPDTSQSGSTLNLSLKELSLKNVRVLQKDEWKGQDMAVSLKELGLDAENIDFKKKFIHLNKLTLDEPVFVLSDYEGKYIDTTHQTKKIKSLDISPFNAGDWSIKIGDLEMINGAFKSDKATDRQIYSYFDASHIHFYGITGHFKNLELKQDTLTSQIKLSAKERSGFTVSNLSSSFRMDPTGMIFDRLDIKTPRSHLTNYYSMRFENFNDDMSHFIGQVKLEGRFKNSVIHSDDIAYFAPELKDWKRSINIDGDVKGTINNLSAKNFVIESGKSSRLEGNIKMIGLPDIDSTYIDFKANDFRTTYADIVTIVPKLKEIKQPNINQISYLTFKGNFTGFIRDFVTEGTIQTNLGTVKTDLNMKLPQNGISSYSGKVEATQFNLGKFLGLDDLGRISFNGSIKGKGFSPKTFDATFDGKFPQIEYNNYNYQNIVVNGHINRKLFKGDVDINDPNAIATLNGTIDFTGTKPEFNFFADIKRGNLKTIGFAKENVSVIGKFDMNFNGDNIDNFLGTVSLYDVAVTRDGETYVFDTLTVSSQVVDKQKILQIRNTEASAFLMGEFTIHDLPNAVKQFLHKYYPTYISAPTRPISDQNFLFQLEVKNVDQYLPLLDKRLHGFNNSTIVGSLNSRTNLMAISATVPHASYQKIEVSDFKLKGVGNMDSLKLEGDVGNTIINDSLQFPSTKISIASSGGVSQLNITTAATQTINNANLSAQITSLEDGVKIHFDPSTVVLNEKTWKIDKGGEITLSKSLVEANLIRISNGEQEITVSTRQSEVGTWNDIIIGLKKVSIADFLPFVLSNPRLEGITTGTVTIEDPFRNLYITADAKAEQFRFENDSIGVVKVNGSWDNKNKKATYEAVSDNKDYKFNVKGAYDGRDSLNQTINTAASFDNTSIHFLEQYLGSIFGSLKGRATGNLTMSGSVKKPDYVGTVLVTDGGIKVLYTQCYYVFDTAKIVFAPGSIDFGTIKLYDTLHSTNPNNRDVATLTGTLQHENFKNFVYNIRANSNKLLLLNTSRTDNSTFYGKAIGRVTFRFTGPEDEMRMSVNAEPVDSSSIYITSSSSKENGQAEYIVWKQYGREMNIDSMIGKTSNLNIALDLTANNYAKLFMVLDEVTGDIIEATGNGTLEIRTGTNTRFTMNGKYTIDRGYYRFSFQEIFKKPFDLLPNEGSYIRWDGDPYNAEIDIKAKYTADNVKLSSLYSSEAQSTDPQLTSLRSERTDVDVQCTLTGLLSKPDITFRISLPAYSDVKNNQRLVSDLVRINNDDNEKNKQVAYLIVFKSFAPIGQYNIQQSDAQTFAFNTISEYVSGYLSSSLKGLMYNIFKDPDLSVNFRYTRDAIDPTNSGATPNSVYFTRDNISLQFIKSLLNDKLVITFGSDFNFVSNGAQSATTQNTNFLFLPDVTAEYKITADGRFRVSFFYRSNFDALSSSGKRDRTGGSFSYRTEFDPPKLRKKKAQPVTKQPKEKEGDDSSSATPKTSGLFP
ncbi:MAG: hypothetical protein C5B52_02060 [Bacteroidetes bacterium]|nr:MAG: hypothetical protein C5B52_02060 [Bacteroidota bacterium]